MYLFGTTVSLKILLLKRDTHTGRKSRFISCTSKERACSKIGLDKKSKLANQAVPKI